MNNLMPGSSIAETIQFLRESLKEFYPQEEISSFINLIFEDLINMSKINIQLNKNIVLNDAIISDINNIVSDLKKFKPIQYILGYTEFYSIKIMLNNSVLIPRQETEELVNWIIMENKERSNTILDIGTGSGCIAISLAKYLKNSTVFGMDISPEGLIQAKTNASLNNVNVNFHLFNILKDNYGDLENKYNIIVSNPPYILESDKNKLMPNVIKYEPEIALFVPDDDPLLFYKAIVEFANKHLENNGFIYLEINENYGSDIIEILNNHQYKDIVLRKDINERDRMIKARREY